LQFENIQHTGQYSTGFEHLSINHELEMSEEIKKEDTMPEDTPLNEEKSSGTDTAHGSKKDKKKKPDHKEDKAREWHDKFNELNDKYLRLYSEFDNYRKRTQKERIELSKNASEEIILSLLPVIDDMERALKAMAILENGQENLTADGIRLIYNKFKGLLSQKGLEPIPALGETFNVDYHDALTNIPAASDDLKGKVVDEIEKGYTLNGKVIRYSKVVVGI
jgi:molecular chaperone GrpE